MKLQTIHSIISVVLFSITATLIFSKSASGLDSVARQLSFCFKNEIAHLGLHEEVDQFIEARQNDTAKTFLARFDPGGFVAAADASVNHDYDADWRRDSSLAWIAKITGWKRGEFNIPRDELIAQIKARIEYHRKTIASDENHGVNLSEARHDRNGNDITDPNDPTKIQEWARGQADGTALAASEIVLEAKTLMALDPVRGYDFVKEHILDNHTPPQGVLKKFAEHISKDGLSHHLKYKIDEGTPNEKTLNGSDTAEAWEEIFGDHYHTALLQIRALSDVSTLAKEMAAVENRNAAATNGQFQVHHQDQAAYYTAAANYYSNTSIPKLLTALDQHWITDTDGSKYKRDLDDTLTLLNRLSAEHPGNSIIETRKKYLEGLAKKFEENPNKAFPPAQRNYIAGTINPDLLKTWHFEKTLQQDAIVISGIVQNYATGEAPIIKATNSQVLAHTHAIETSNRQLFPKESQINGVPPVARYFQDFWQGAPVEVLQGKTDEDLKISRNEIGKTGLYAWTLLTQDYASYYSIVGNETLKTGKIQIDSTNLGFYQDLLPHAGLEPNQVITKNDPIYRQMLGAIQVRMDSYASMAHESYTQIKKGEKGLPDMPIPVAEGYHPVTRLPLGPENLTWTYTSWFNMVWNRKSFLDRLNAAYPKL